MCSQNRDSDQIKKNMIDSNIQIVERIHSPKISLLSNEQTNVGFFGLVNMCVLLLILSNFRSLLMTISRDGIFVNIFYINPFSPLYLHLITKTIFVLSSFGIISYIIEKFLCYKTISELFGQFLQIFNLLAILIYPLFHINDEVLDPLIASVQMLLYISVVLKLYSYHNVNFWLRSGRIIFKANPDKIHATHYPDNLTLSNLFYFLWLPTFCYELDFPQTKHIRPTFIIKRLIEIVIINGMILATFQQTILPFLTKNYEADGANIRPKILRTIEDIFLISSPNFLMWLMFFYVMFHSTMNAWAELMYFADREFYRDWWNACSVSYFWKNWNIPIYRFCKRHIYLPLVRRGYSQLTASTVVFLVSAILHEYIASATLGIVSYWAFLGMLIQIPLHFIIQAIDNRILKNAIFWLNLMIGQPLAFTMYFREYVQINNVTSVMGIHIRK